MDMDEIWNLFRKVSIDTQVNVASPSRAQSSGGFTSLNNANLATSSSAKPPVHIGKINDHVYEFSNLSGRRPSLELVFFHGINLEGSREPHLDTWLSRDASELWPIWILKYFPDARILTISYDAHEKTTDEVGRNDMYVTTENLLHDLVGANLGGSQIGQVGCPVVLVGHCIGGLVMKQLCVYANLKLSLVSDPYKTHIRNFLENMRGLCFYATPHLGTRLADMDTPFIKGPLFQNATTLNRDVARQNEYFRSLCKSHGWKTFGIGENFAITRGQFRGLLVPEASARHQMDTFYTIDANHIDVCRPESTTSSSFSRLVSFIQGIVQEATVVVRGLPNNAIDQKWRARHASNTTQLSKYLMEQERPAWNGSKTITTALMIAAKCGMGRLGKMSVPKRMFNTMSKDFEYTCFVDDAKSIDVQKFNDTVLEQFHHNGVKFDEPVAQWSQLKDKKVLLVVDDLDSEEQLRMLPELKDFSQGSCLIVTSRDRELFKFYGKCVIYEIVFLSGDYIVTKLVDVVVQSYEKWEISGSTQKSSFANLPVAYILFRVT